MTNSRPAAASGPDETRRMTSDRRRFLAGAAAVAGGVALAPSLTRAADAAAVSVAEGPKVLRTPEGHAIPPTTQRFMANRAGSVTSQVAASHVPMQSQPKATLTTIMNPTHAVS